MQDHNIFAEFNIEINSNKLTCSFKLILDYSKINFISDGVVEEKGAQLRWKHFWTPGGGSIMLWGCFSTGKLMLVTVNEEKEENLLEIN